MQNSNDFAFVLKNIFVDHGDVKTTAGRFTEYKMLNLRGKIKLLDFNKERKTKVVSKVINIKKTAAVKNIKNEASIRKEYKLFKGNLKRNSDNFMTLNYAWFQKCFPINIYADGPMLREETIYFMS